MHLDDGFKKAGDTSMLFGGLEIFDGVKTLKTMFDVQGDPAFGFWMCDDLCL